MVSGRVLAIKGVELTLQQPRIKYNEYDCQGFMELIFQKCGQPISYAGSNDMIRNACSWVGTLDEAKRMGYLREGVALFILEQNGGEPAKYKGDGIGNASHVGMYVGENALFDVDKKDELRRCNVVHSSSSMGGAYGSTLQNAWTHVGLWKNVDFGIQTNGDDTMSNEINVNVPVEVEYAVVRPENKGTVNFRTKMNSKAERILKMPRIPYNALVEVNYYQGEWANVTYEGYTGFVMKEFLVAATEEASIDKIEEDIAAVEKDDSIGDVEEKAKLYRVYIDFHNKNDALAFHAAMKGACIGSVK